MIFFATLTRTSHTLQEDQNTNEPLLPKEVTPLEVYQVSDPIPLETSPPTPDEIKEETFPQPQTPNSQPQTDSMEVQKHPHHVMHKKKWNEYLLEFFMLFLAVFLGFVAENIRERITEHERAKIYAATMVSDLTADTSELNEYVEYMSYAANNVDTLFQLLSEATPQQIPSGKLYWYGLWGGTPRIFIPNDATFQQMKSAGTLRYFSNNLMQQVAKYDQLIRRMKNYEEQDERIFTEVRKIRSQIFEVKFNEAANDLSSRALAPRSRIDSLIRTNPPLLTYDKSIFNEYLELVRSRFLNRKVRDATGLLQQARTLIYALKKEYHLD